MDGIKKSNRKIGKISTIFLFLTSIDEHSHTHTHAISFKVKQMNSNSRLREGKKSKGYLKIIFEIHKIFHRLDKFLSSKIPLPPQIYMTFVCLLILTIFTHCEHHVKCESQQLHCLLLLCLDIQWKWIDVCVHLSVDDGN